MARTKQAKQQEYGRNIKTPKPTITQTRNPQTHPLSTVPSQFVPFGADHFGPGQVLFTEACSWPLKAALSSPPAPWSGPKNMGQQPLLGVLDFIFLTILFFVFFCRWTSLGTNFPISHTILHWQEQDEINFWLVSLVSFARFAVDTHLTWTWSRVKPQWGGKVVASVSVCPVWGLLSWQYPYPPPLPLLCLLQHLEHVLWSLVRSECIW